MVAFSDLLLGAFIRTTSELVSGDLNVLVESDALSGVHAALPIDKLRGTLNGAVGATVCDMVAFLLPNIL